MDSLKAVADAHNEVMIASLSHVFAILRRVLLAADVSAPLSDMAGRVGT